MTIPVDAEAPPSGARTSASTKWAIALFFVAIAIPGSFYVGVRMTPYRLYLILMAIPMVLRFLKDPTLRVTWVDILVLIASFWQMLAILVIHQTSQIIYAGASFLEFFFGYMLGRVFIRNAADYRFFFKCFLLTLLFFFPFAILENITFQRILRNVASVVFVQPPLDLGGQIRFGFMRAQLSFEHAILFGTFCSIGFANVYYTFKHMFPANLLFAAFVAATTVTAISSAPMIALFIQGCLIAYELIFRKIKSKWVLSLFFGAVIWVGFQLVFSRSIVDYVLSEFVINQDGVNSRIWQLEYGIREVLAHPMFGVGLNGWAHPFWQGGVIDNYWLNTSIRFGLVETFFLVAAMSLHAVRIATAGDLDAHERQIRLGYLFAYVALIFVLSTVSLWATIIVFKMVYLGAGAWLYDKPAAAGPPRRGRPERRPLAVRPGRSLAAGPSRPAFAAR